MVAVNHLHELMIHPTTQREWIEWNGGECPVIDCVVYVETRSDRIDPICPRDQLGVWPTSQCQWQHTGDGWDVRAYRKAGQ